MLWTGGVVLWSFFIVSQQSWEDVKVGDCLPQQDLTRLSGIQHFGLFKSQECSGADVFESGTHYQTFACGLEVEVGSWESERAEHRKAGIYLPWAVPCQRSTIFARNVWEFYDPEAQLQACHEDELRLIFEQTESLDSSMYTAGQGRVYLPNPLRVQRRYHFQLGEERFQLCNETRVRMSYEGWGDFWGTLQEWSCDENEEQALQFCREAKFSISETQKGEMCMLVNQLEDCSQ